MAVLYVSHRADEIETLNCDDVVRLGAPQQQQAFDGMSCVAFKLDALATTTPRSSTGWTPPEIGGRLNERQCWGEEARRRLPYAGLVPISSCRQYFGPQKQAWRRPRVLPNWSISNYTMKVVGVVSVVLA